MAEYCDIGDFPCKYCEDGACVFFAMGSGDVNDMPCVSNAKVTRLVHNEGGDNNDK